MARFIKKQGMIPLIRITWSNRSMYSDALGEDIWSKGMFNAAVKAYIAEREERFLPSVHMHLHNHPIHASIEMLCDKIDELLMEWDLDMIYVATEDATYCEYLRKRYGERVSLTDQERYTTKKDQLLVQKHAEEEKRPGFALGAEYAASIALLSKCNSILASGWCGGTSEALRQNDGRYQHTYIFELGVHEG